MWSYFRDFFCGENSYSVKARKKRIEAKIQSYENGTRKINGETVYKIKCVMNQRQPYPFKSVFRRFPPSSNFPNIKNDTIRGANHFISISIAEAVNRLPKDEIAAFPKQTYELKNRSNWGYRGNHCFGNVEYKVNGKFGFRFSLEEINVREVLINESRQTLRSSSGRLALQLYFLSYANHCCIQSSLQTLLGCAIDKEYPKVILLFSRCETLSKVLSEIGKPWGADRYEPILDNQHVQYIIFEVVRGLQYLQKWILQHNAISLESVVVDGSGHIKLHDFSEISSFDVEESAFNPPGRRLLDTYSTGLLAFAVYFGTSVIRCEKFTYEVIPQDDENFLDALHQIAPLVYQRVIRHEQRSPMIFDFINFATGRCGYFAAELTKCSLIKFVDENTYDRLYKDFCQLLTEKNVVIKSTIYGIPEFCHPPSLNPVHQDGFRPNPPRIKYDSKKKKPFFEENDNLKIEFQIYLTDKYLDGYHISGFAIFSERAILKLLMTMIDTKDKNGRYRFFAADLIVLRAAIQSLLEEIYMIGENSRLQNSKNTSYASRNFELIPNPFREKRHAQIKLLFVKPKKNNQELDNFRKDIKNGFSYENVKIEKETQFLSNSQNSEDYTKYGYIKDSVPE